MEELAAACPSSNALLWTCWLSFRELLWNFFKKLGCWELKETGEGGIGKSVFPLPGSVFWGLMVSLWQQYLNNAKCVFPWCAFKIYLCYGWQTATVANVILNVPWWKEKQVLSSSQHEKQTNNSSFLIVKLPDKSDAKMFSEVVNYLKIVGRHFFRYTA